MNALVLGTWFALLAGFGDVLLYFVTSVLLQRYVHLSPQLIWISPISSVLLFALPGLVFVALARWRPARYWPFITVAFFACLTVWGLTTYATRLHSLAAFVLALGIAVQTARVMTAHPRAARTLVAYTLPLMAGLVIVGGLGLSGWERIRERRAVADLPPAAEGAPNVLLIILDTVRAASLSLYGYSRRTAPALERFATRGVVFDRAISASPWTLPSHATMFTGRWPHELNANWYTPLDATFPTLAEVLAEHGYATAGFVANGFYASRKSGLARGFQHYDDIRISSGRILLGSATGRLVMNRTPLPKWLGVYDEIGRKRARDVNAEMLDWMAHRGAETRPFFVFLNYMDAHSPYVPPAPFNTFFDKQVLPSHPWMPSDSVLVPASIASETAAYDESLTALDHHIGLLLGELDRRRVLQNTIVVITSDHGEELGEHGFLRHGKNLYMQVLHVPLVISFSRLVPGGVRVSKPVTLRDVPATLIDLARVPNQFARSSSALSGRSLSRFWTDTLSGANGVDTILSEVRYRPNRPRREPTSAGDLASIVDSTQHLIRTGDGRIELYKIDDDPGEHRNLAALAETRDKVERLSAMLRALVPMSIRR